jgi:hypothetical protein
MVGLVNHFTSEELMSLPASAYLKPGKSVKRTVKAWSADCDIQQEGDTRLPTGNMALTCVIKPNQSKLSLALLTRENDLYYVLTLPIMTTSAHVTAYLAGA